MMAKKQKDDVDIEDGATVDAVKTIAMIKVENGQDKTADVHPNEVDHMQQHGWSLK